MTRISRPRLDTPAVPDPADRPLDEIAGDIRDRLTVLLNATEVMRLACPEEDPHLVPILRLIEQQVGSLGRLADELCRPRRVDAVPAAGVDGLFLAEL